MSKRHRDAVAIQQGASNPSGVARSLVQAIDEAREENPSTDYIRQDAACRMICHQLAFLMGVGRIDHGEDSYHDLITECERRAAE